MSECIGLAGRLFGRKFEPVITKSAAKFPPGKLEVTVSMVEKFRDETFHGCICKRCGERREAS